MFCEMLGIAKGVKDADPSVLLCVNATWTHWGFLQQYSRDMKAIPSFISGYVGITSLPVEMGALHWYSDMEYNNNYNGAPAQGKGFSVFKTKMAGFYTYLGISECGLNATKASYNPNNWTVDQYYADQVTKYVKTDPKVDFFAWYEWMKEPISRGAGTPESKYGSQNSTNKTSLDPTIIACTKIQPF